jgi:hypothetical protein
LFTYVLVVFLILHVGKLVGARGRLQAILLCWGYTLIPTVLWFLVTSLLYVIIPPPRTQSTAGITFSVLFLSFSTVLFFWKFMLSYLALRFGLRLDLPRIGAVIAISLPIIGLYSALMYRLGIFRIPFL